VGERGGPDWGGWKDRLLPGKVRALASYRDAKWVSGGPEEKAKKKNTKKKQKNRRQKREKALDHQGVGTSYQRAPSRRKDTQFWGGHEGNKERSAPVIETGTTNRHGEKSVIVINGNGGTNRRKKKNKKKKKKKKPNRTRGVASLEVHLSKQERGRRIDSCKKKATIAWGARTQKRAHALHLK